VSAGTPPWTLAAGQCGVEGPCAGPGGWVLNVCSLDRTDQPTWPTRGGDIVATHLDRPRASTILLNTGGIPVALAFGPDGALYVTDERRRAIVRVAAAGEPTDVITHWQGDAINGPNDLAFDEDGNLYFSDPWTSSPNNPIGAVYGHDATTGELHRLDAGMWFPNGVVVRDDTLLVAETFRRAIWAYELRGQGRASNKRLFAELPDAPDAPRLAPTDQARLGVDHLCGPDGMALDATGQLYVAQFGAAAVYVLDDLGHIVDQRPVPGRNPTNVCFAGPAHDQLVVTIDDTGEVVVLDGVATGLRLPFCPTRADTHPWAARLGHPGEGGLS
jgi:sugar lactone lactonase YvrE